MEQRFFKLKTEVKEDLRTEHNCYVENILGSNEDSNTLDTRKDFGPKTQKIGRPCKLSTDYKPKREGRGPKLTVQGQG